MTTQELSELIDKTVMDTDLDSKVGLELKRLANQSVMLGAAIGGHTRQVLADTLNHMLELQESLDQALFELREAGER